MVDKSAEKKKRDALIQSIASEETVKARLAAEVTEKKAELLEHEKMVAKAKEQVEYWTKASLDAERVFRELEAKVKPLHSEIDALKNKCAELDTYTLTA